jgi:hypothetical protein
VRPARKLLVLVLVLVCGPAFLCARLALAQALPPMADMPAMAMMSGLYGSYPMNRESSGTSWQPDLTPTDGRMAHRNGWMLMAHGFVTTIYDRQGGARGDDKLFVTSMLMGMAQRSVGNAGRLGLRAMVSLDPLMGRRGYPLLFASGETADGATPLVDRQHPHDLLMELSVAYSRDVAPGTSWFVYGGLPGEPALGPPAFMHRGSSRANPEAPLAHHWMDSTHIAFGVVTLGAIRGALKLEASVFNAREPDQHRYDVETAALDSWSGRLTWNPSPAWSLQLSQGWLESPEQLEPQVAIRRGTASVAWAPRERWQLLIGFGRNREQDAATSHAHASDAWQFEASLQLQPRLTAFARLERIEPRHIDSDATVGKLTLGLSRELGRVGALRWAVGALASAYGVPDALQSDYGSSPLSGMLFVSARLDEAAMR